MSIPNNLAQSAIVETLNPDANPPNINGNGQFSPLVWDLTDNQVGWYYTPTLDYELTRIDSRFGSNQFSNISEGPISVSVYSARPAVGGGVLTSATFQANFITGGVQGVDLSPIDLTKGTNYFIGFSGINGLGLNVDTWSGTPGNEMLSGGATTALDAWYVGDQFQTERTLKFDMSGGGHLVAPTAPILFFTGNVVPEPTSSLLLTFAVGAYLCGFRTVRRPRGCA